MKKLWIGIITTAAMAGAVHAAVIVDFGAAGGMTNIVTSSARKADGSGTTYALLGVGSPDGGYVGQPYYGAQSSGLNNSTIVQDRQRDGTPENNWEPKLTAADYMQFVKNGNLLADSIDSMVAFEQQDWLNPGADELLSMEVRFENRGGTNGTTASFLIETGDGWYKSVESHTVTSTTVPENWSLGVADLTWVSFTGLGVVGGVAAPDLTDLESAGVYFAAVNSVGNKFYGTKIEYINVTAIPEPATLGLMGIAGLGMLLARRRITM
jgi:hypothetical protein